MPSKGTPTRNIRVSNELWAQAQNKAALEGRTVSEVVLAALKRYVTTPPRKTQP